MKSLAPTTSFLNESRVRFLAAANRITDENWLISPEQDVWSAAEIVAHVGMVEESIIERCKKASASLPRPLPPLKKIHLPLVLATWRGKKVRSPVPLKPERIGNREQAYATLEQIRQRSLEFFDSVYDRDLSAHHFPHPFFGSLNLYEWYRFIGYHELRHRKQLCELVEIFHP
jgi:hypothetical protein